MKPNILAITGIFLTVGNVVDLWQKIGILALGILLFGGAVVMFEINHNPAR